MTTHQEKCPACGTVYRGNAIRMLSAKNPRMGQTTWRRVEGSTTWFVREALCVCGGTIEIAREFPGRVIVEEVFGMWSSSQTTLAKVVRRTPTRLVVEVKGTERTYELQISIERPDRGSKRMRPSEMAIALGYLKQNERKGGTKR